MGMGAHNILSCTFDRHAEAILKIFNDAILISTALYDYKPRPLTSMGPWFDTKLKDGFPVIGLEDDNGALLALGSYGTFRAWPAYKYNSAFAMLALFHKSASCSANGSTWRSSN